MRRSYKGFTLIELLVVIAIIAILAAIIFPVYSRAKIAGYRSSDISNLNSVRNALQLYRADQGAYPPALLGYATLYSGTPNVMPADQIRSFLYSRRIDSVETFRPALNRPPTPQNGTITQAVWPTADGRAIGTAPEVDLNGDGKVDATDDLAGARQAFGPTDTVMRSWAGSYDVNEDVLNVGNVATPFPASFYNVSGYDVATVPVPGQANRTELRYALFWTSASLIGSGGVFGGLSDDPRQLGYSEPPENTVITWDSFFRDYSDGALQREKTEIVLFLGGAAKPYDSVDMANRSWRILP
jgi:prepilin-type N-terminal cleavage/methylation domain-containing protein